MIAAFSSRHVRDRRPSPAQVSSRESLIVSDPLSQVPSWIPPGLSTRSERSDFVELCGQRIFLKRTLISGGISQSVLNLLFNGTVVNKVTSFGDIVT